MEVTVKKSLWNYAGIAGLLMGLTSTASMFAGQYLSTLGLSEMMTIVTGLALWAAETGICIYLMVKFMKKFAAANPSADHTAIFRMGMATAFLSALVYSAASFANIAYISADYFAEQYQILMQQMAPMMDSNTMEQMDDMLGIMPQLTFFSNLIYCFFYGTILSFILSRNIPDRNPFAERSSDEW